ncbi:MAG: hypothetical protein WCS89_02105 [Candidatus Paceibacterota bacterium]
MINEIQTEKDFSEQLIKGKITELVFERMFRTVGHFTVIPFGYENTLPEIVQYQHLAKYPQVFDTIKTAPDFAIVSHDRSEVFLVEVKYRTGHTDKAILELAGEIQKKWKLVRLFLATPSGFYFDSCSNIIKNEGKISTLGPQWVNDEVQKEYLELLNQFIIRPN